jgi:hypothetical protein
MLLLPLLMVRVVLLLHMLAGQARTWPCIPSTVVIAAFQLRDEIANHDAAGHQGGRHGLFLFVVIVTVAVHGVCHSGRADKKERARVGVMTAPLAGGGEEAGGRNHVPVRVTLCQVVTALKCGAGSRVHQKEEEEEPGQGKTGKKGSHEPVGA